MRCARSRAGFVRRVSPSFEPAPSRGLTFTVSPADNDAVITRARRAARPLSWAILLLLSSCGTRMEKLQAPETFSWCPQPIAFSPPPSRWWRQGTNGDGTLGVRFILTGGGGQCISVAGYSSFVERDRRDAVARLIARRDS